MTYSKDKVETAKDKILGEVKETIGKATGDHSLELEGKIQSIKADFEKKTDIGDKMKDIKQGIAGKINELIDQKKDQ